MIKPLLIALSAYSIIPVPHFDWSEDNMKFSLCFLPVVGIIEGVLLLLWVLFCGYFEVGNILFAAVSTVLPLVITGGIHMDGYIDCIDALSSHRDRKKMLEILKDPHVGAFAIIYTAIYLLVVFGLYAEISDSILSLVIIAIGYVLSRSLAAFSAVAMKNARKEGFLVSFSNSAHKKTVIASMIIISMLSVAAMIYVNFTLGILSALFAGLSLLLYAGISKKFGGITGDTTGYFIQMCELFILIGIFIGKV